MVRFWLKEILLSLLKNKHFNIIHDTSTKIETLLHLIWLLICWYYSGRGWGCFSVYRNSCILESSSSCVIWQAKAIWTFPATTGSEVCRYPFIQTTCVSLGGKEGSLTKIWIFFLLMRRYPTKRAFFLLVVLPFKFFPW